MYTLQAYMYILHVCIFSAEERKALIFSRILVRTRLKNMGQCILRYNLNGAQSGSEENDHIFNQ